MAIWVYSCDGARQEVTGVFGQPNSYEFPACDPASAGQWVEVSQNAVGFQDYTVDGAQFADLLEITVLVLVVAYTVRIVVRAIRGNK